MLIATTTTTTATGLDEIGIRLLIDLVAITVFAIGIYFVRHRRSDLAMVFWFFNVCLFVTVSVIQMTEVAAALGFGLFAILSIIRLRSEPFSNREIGYFFGALVMGLLNGIGTTHVWFTLLLNGLLLVSMFVLDHPGALHGEQRRHVILDRVETDDGRLAAIVGERLGIDVVSVQVIGVDLVRDTMELEVCCRPPSRRVAPTSTGHAAVPA